MVLKVKRLLLNMEKDLNEASLKLPLHGFTGAAENRQRAEAGALRLPRSWDVKIEKN